MDEFAGSSYRRHYGHVFRFIRRRTATAQEAEDLTQEVFEASLAALADERLTAEPELAWLYTVAERRLIRTWRRRISTESLDTGHELAGSESYGSGVSEALLTGLRHLPRPQREVVVAKLLRGQPFAEIAARLEISEEACRMRLSRGLAALRAHLKAVGVEP
jgi:RNA polymerase sigma factor (sigma-70 family)